MRKPNEDLVRHENSHFGSSPLVFSYLGDAKDIDPWAAENGYSNVVQVSCGSFVAHYGLFSNGDWHCWAN